MSTTTVRPTSPLARDLTAGLVVFLVALPLCLGVALASNAPLFSGLLAGIIGGILVGLLSGSQSSISGPAAGLTVVVAAQIAALGSFRAFLFAVLLAGLIQIGLGLARAGFLAAFVPSGVIKGLLAAIGAILVLKQIPHVLGHDADPEGEMSFQQPDHETTFSELLRLLEDFHPGAALVGLLSTALLVLWERVKRLKKSGVPGPLVVVLTGVAVSLLLQRLGGRWAIGASHMVQVPVAGDLAGFLGFLQWPDFSQWSNPAVYTAALTIAAVASLETLLNLEAVDKLDPLQRSSPPSRELLAQGVGNVVAGLVGGIPVTSVIVRSSVNLDAGGRTKLSAVFHGVLLLVSVMLIPAWLNLIPLSCLGAVLLVAGVKLASPAEVMRIWREGRYKFIPFVLTAVSIVLTDLLVGVLIGLATSMSFILWSNARRPIRRIVEKHLGGEVVHVELAAQVSFLSRAALARTLDEVPPGSHILIDARSTDYIDPDVLEVIREFHDRTAPARDVKVSLSGFRQRYHLQDQSQYVDYSTRELQATLSPSQVLQILRDGQERFRTGRRLTRDLGRPMNGPAAGQHPLAVVLSCVDARSPAELIFDLGVGDVFVVRIAGNVASPEVLASIEYACVGAGARLILVMGHSGCGAVASAVDLFRASGSVAELTGCEHLDSIVGQIQQAIDPIDHAGLDPGRGSDKAAFVDAVARRHVARVVDSILDQSPALNDLAREGRIAVVGAFHDVDGGDIAFYPARGASLIEAGDPPGQAAP